ncbi:hypothetical protein JCM8097_002604 [Rhodosporidiobolus ruineniae]
MSSHEALFHCPCASSFNATRPPPSLGPLATFQHHPLSDLLFCEDCDAIRCDQCAAHEIACYYCPNCLFEVPSASVRGEKNRCARNCFQCPTCDHTLSVVASDPDPSIPLNTAAASVGEPPYFLTCNFCGWDSKEVGVTFEKPTGLAAQLTKGEERNPEVLEFDHIKDHLEPYLRRSQAQAAHHGPGSHAHGPAASSSSAVVNAASAQLFRDIPGLGSNRYGAGLFGTSARSRAAAHDAGTGVDELEKYRSLYLARGGGVGSDKENRRAKVGAEKGKGVDRDAEAVRAMRDMTDWEDVASLDQRWTSSWKPPVMSRELRPLRTPLQAKRSKRCPACKHILIKPEQKSSSTRYKIKLVAANYLPSVTLYRRPPASIGSRLSAIAAGTASGLRRTPRSGAGRSGETSAAGGAAAEDEPLRPGRTYTFELSFTNPLYDKIGVRLLVARPGGNKPPAEGEALPPPPFAVNVPTREFGVSAFAEDWEYEDDEDAVLREEEEDEGEGNGGEGSPKKKRRGKEAGIVERRMNRTTVAMEVAVARDAVGPLRVRLLPSLPSLPLLTSSSSSLQANMLVTYVYRVDDGSGAPPSPTKSPVKGGGRAAENLKSFSFWTLLPLGTVQPRTGGEARRSMAVSSSSG